jgi:hypothetical protein
MKNKPNNKKDDVEGKYRNELFKKIIEDENFINKLKKEVIRTYVWII